MAKHLARSFSFAAAGVLLSSAAAAEPIVTDQLVAFLDFEEGSGQTAQDGTGNGHEATLVGGVTWGEGYVHVHDHGDKVRVDSSDALRSSTFTYDLWFEARGSSLGGRILHQARRIGGHGPDLLEWYGRKVSFRITRGSDAVFDSPLVGTLTTPEPPNHMAQCDESFHKQDGPEHLVFIHDAGAKRVTVFQGLRGEPLELTYDGTYSGSYGVTSSDLVLGNTLEGEDRVHPSRFYQFGYYGKALSYSVDGNGHATGGEILTNHQAGPNVVMGDDDPDDDDLDDGDDGTACDLRSDGYGQSLQLLDVLLGDATQLTFQIQGVPDPAQLTAATLTMSLSDADHPGEEGTIYVNGQGPLELPADASWDNRDSTAAIAVPLSMLVEGANTIAFGGGARDRTYYEVGKVALSLEGPACPQADFIPAPGSDEDAELDADNAGLSGVVCAYSPAGQDRHGSHVAAWAVLSLLGLAVIRKRRAS